MALPSGQWVNADKMADPEVEKAAELVDSVSALRLGVSVNRSGGKYSKTDAKSVQKLELPTHLFVELTSLEELSFPTSSSDRIRYTCLSASSHYLAVGSTSGTVYLFSRYAARYRKTLNSVPVQVISAKEGSVQQISTSPNEKYLSVATSRGHVSVISLAGPCPATILNSNLHIGSRVTAFCWYADGSRLFVADSSGLLTCCKIGSRNLFRSATETLIQVDGGVVQLDVHNDCLLVSTVSRCYLYDYSRSSCQQIGRKLRSGPYGACFYPTENEERPLIFCGRPNGRLWEVDRDGVVYSTHQFAHLSTLPTAPLVSYRTFSRRPIDWDAVRSPPVISFYRLSVVEYEGAQYVLTVNDTKICVVEPRKAAVVVVCDTAQEVPQYSITGSDFFFLDPATDSLRKLSLFSFVKAVEKLHIRQCHEQAAKLMLSYAPSMNSVPWKPETICDVLQNVRQQAEEEESTTVSRLSSLLLQSRAEFAVAAASVSNSTANFASIKACKLPGGVHRVFANSGYDDDFTFRAPRSLRRSWRSSSAIHEDQQLRNLTADPSHSRRSSPQLSLVGQSFVRSPTALSSPQQSNGNNTPTGDEKLGISQPRSTAGLVIDINYPLEMKWLQQNGGANGPPPTNWAGDDPELTMTNNANSPLLLNGGLVEPLPAVPAVLRTKMKSSKKRLGNPRTMCSMPTPPPAHVKRNELKTVALKTNVVKSIVKEKNASRFCAECGLHRSWTLALTLSRFFDGPCLFGNFFAEGGVPSAAEEWSKLLKLWRQLNCNNNSSTATTTSSLCSKCLSCFSVEKRKTNRELDGARMSSLVSDIPSGKMLSIFGGNIGREGDKMEVEESASCDSSLACSTYLNPVFQESTNSSSSTAEALFDATRFEWLGQVALFPLAALISRNLGAEAAASIFGVVFEFAVAAESNATDDGFFESLANLLAIAGDDDAAKSLPLKIRNALLAEAAECLGETWTGTSCASNNNTDDKRSKGVARKLEPYCGACCTRLAVADSTSPQSSVLVFKACGHAYHTFCLSKAKYATECLLCAGDTAL